VRSSKKPKIPKIIKAVVLVCADLKAAGIIEKKTVQVEKVLIIIG